MDASPNSQPLSRLAALIKQRRMDIGMSMHTLSAEAGISVNTYRRLESGEPVRELHYAKIESAIGWAAGSITEILNGAEPTLAGRNVGDGIVITAVPTHVLEDEDVAQAVTSAMVASTDSLTAAEIRDVTSRVVAELKRRGLLGK